MFSFSQQITSFLNINRFDNYQTIRQISPFDKLAKIEILPILSIWLYWAEKSNFSNFAEIIFAFYNEILTVLSYSKIGIYSKIQLNSLLTKGVYKFQMYLWNLETENLKILMNCYIRGRFITLMKIMHSMKSLQDITENKNFPCFFNSLCIFNRAESEK